MKTAVELVQALAWPIAAVVIALLVLSKVGLQLLERLMGRVKRVRAFGVDLELEVTPEGASRVRADLEATFSSYRAAIKSEFDRQANILQIADLRRHVIEKVVNPHLAADAATPPYRSTIHVRDILLHEAMYQLLEYLPSGGATRGAGRTFSMRFGIVGEAWRTGVSQHQVIVKPGDSYLITNWGMLPEEAASAGMGKRSFAAAVLIEKELVVGVFYLDSPDADVFTPQLLTLIENASRETGLTSALAALQAKMLERGPSFTIFDA